MGPERVIDPQQLNLYAYGRNNPLRFTDPTGEIIEENVDEKYRKRYGKWKREYLSTEAGRKQWAKYADDKNFLLKLTINDQSAGGKFGAEASNYQWNEQGQLTGATISLGSKLDQGYPSPSSYPVTSSLVGTDASNEILAVAKFAHEFGHVNRTGQEDASLFQLQQRLIPEYNSIFFSNGRNTDDPQLNSLVQQMGGTPISISEGREHWAEANTIPYLRDRFPGKSMPKQIRKAIETYQKTYPGR